MNSEYHLTFDLLSGGVPALLAKFPRHCAERDTSDATYPTNEWDRAADVSAIFPTKFEECDKQLLLFCRLFVRRKTNYATT